MENINTLLEIGVGGAFAIIILLIVFKFLKSRPSPNGKDCLKTILNDVKEIKKDVQEVKSKNNDLHDWHNVHENGAKIWYVRKSLEEAIHNLADNIKEQTRTFQAMVNELIIMKKDVEILGDKIK